jgi:hypothetical protein
MVDCPKCNFWMCDRLSELFDHSRGVVINKWCCLNCGHIWKTEDKIEDVLGEVNTIPPEYYIEDFDSDGFI